MAFYGLFRRMGPEELAAKFRIYNGFMKFINNEIREVDIRNGKVF